MAIKLLLNKEKCAKNLAWVRLPYCAHHKQEILLYLIIYVCLAINMIGKLSKFLVEKSMRPVVLNSA